MSDMGDDHPCPCCRSKDFNQETRDAIQEKFDAIGEAIAAKQERMSEFCEDMAKLLKEYDDLLPSRHGMLEGDNMGCSKGTSRIGF